MALRLAMVSSSDSPLAADDLAMSRLITSALRRLAAISKVVRVRVEFSKNRLKTLFPRSKGTFLTSRLPTETKLVAVSSTWVRMLLGRPSVDSKWISSPFLLSCGLRWYNMLDVFHVKTEAAVLLAQQRQRLGGGQRDARAAQVGLDRQFAATAVYQHRQLDAGRAAKVKQFVQHRAHRAPGEQHIVKQQHMSPIDVKRDLRLGTAGHAAACIVVAVHRRRDHAKRLRQAQVLVQALGQPDAARGDTQQLRVGLQQRAQRSEEHTSE